MSYGKNADLTLFMDNTRIHVLPSMNPDGFEMSCEGDCDGAAGRHNANGFDLNQNVPDAFRERKVERQNETEHVIKWISSIPFALSANVHTGAMVAVYPYNSLTKEMSEEYNSTTASGEPYRHLTPDTDVFYHLASVYSLNHPFMYTGQSEGIKGRVIDTNGNPIKGASVYIKGRDNILPYNTTADGEYYQLLLTGRYTILVVSKELLVHLINYLATMYGFDEDLTAFIDNTQIHVMPTMNPDGAEVSDPTDCYGTTGR
ncbi:carboxypeptidase M-like [Scyliorhinus torazame]|uniref:carboxypeptidase M-like n=1 Tax=Scyliorhinus torazame TaxID=75743 RepID=UPI003B594FB8